jgi:hypothetical protein
LFFKIDIPIECFEFIGRATVADTDKRFGAKLINGFIVTVLGVFDDPHRKPLHIGVVGKEIAIERFELTIH